MAKTTDADLDEALKDSFPASDPPAATNPSRFTGPEVTKESDTAAAVDARIRRKAYELWQEEGRPDGRAEEHWKLASDIVASEP
ncbi:MAG: DUF2934 domain-containing protein [Rhizobiales bacterium]|nr:DUF2934 domain-containing protein [Hyphomicrobiales bacterium]